MTGGRSRIEDILNSLKNGTQIGLDDVDYLEATIAFWKNAYFMELAMRRIQAIDVG